MSFAASWLALREPFDHSARASSLTEQLCAHLENGAADPVQVLDLACGTGSSLRFLAPRIGTRRQRWRMADNDPALLALLPQMPNADVEAVCCDLAQDLQCLALAESEVVTASALLDLVSGEWIDRFIAELAPARPALLFALSYDGSMQWEPELPDDQRMTAWFNLHQRTDKGFGVALGPAATAQARQSLEAAGFTVTLASSDWRLGADDQAVQREVAAGVADAVAALAAIGVDTGRIARAWLRQRRSWIDAGRSSLKVGHTDLLALPGTRSGHNPTRS